MRATAPPPRREFRICGESPSRPPRAACAQVGMLVHQPAGEGELKRVTPLLGPDGFRRGSKVATPTLVAKPTLHSRSSLTRRPRPLRRGQGRDRARQLDLRPLALNPDFF